LVFARYVGLKLTLYFLEFKFTEIVSNHKLALRLVEFALLDPIAAPDPCPASNVRLHTSGRTRSRPKRQPANQHNNERARTTQHQSGGVVCSARMAIQQLMFLFSSGSRQENNKIAPQKTQLVFSHVSLLLFVLLTRWDIFSESAECTLCAAAAAGWLAGVSSSPAPRPTGIMESRRAVSQSVRRAASAGLTRRLSERRRHSTCPAPNNGPRRTNPRLNTHLITARPPLMALESKNKEFHSRTRKQGAKKRASERRRRPEFLTPRVCVCDPILAVCGAARRKIMAT
jgi:hypothetical protein